MNKKISLLLLIPSEDRKVALALVLDKLRVLHRVYQAVQPMQEFAQDVADYKKIAVEMGQMLIANFGYCPWPSYLHKVIEHVQEIMQHEDGPGTVVGLSREGNKGGNRIFTISESIFLEEVTPIVRLGMYFGYIGFTPALLYSSWQVLFSPNRGALCVF